MGGGGIISEIFKFCKYHILMKKLRKEGTKRKERLINGGD
jgi:hypothetical protein